MRNACLGLVLAIGALGCEEEDPCQDYVDYMCECHRNDEGFDCAELQATYDKAGAEVQDTCALDLDQQKVDDEDDTGLSCEA